jgi:branched-chain amino acid transport system permease protein
MNEVTYIAKGAERRRSQRFVIALAVVALLVLPWVITNDYYLRIVVLSGFYTILAVSLNITTGFTGLLSVGHAAFFGMGAYMSALLMVNTGWSFWPALLAGASAAAVIGCALGFMAIRLRGDYLAIATICFAEVLRLLALNWTAVTRGPMGVPGIPAPELFGMALDTQQAFYYLVGAAVVLVIYTASVIKASPFGQALLALRDNEMAAEATGINTRLYKVIAFTIGAMFAGLAGAIYAPWLTFISPDNFSYLESVMILCMLIVGGLGSIWGVAFGAILITVSLEILRPFETFRMAIFGGLLVALMIYRPQGMFGDFEWRGFAALRESIRSLLFGRRSQTGENAP